MRCPNCGHENDNKRRYCEQCGEYLFPEDASEQTQRLHKVETVVKTDKKRVFRWIFSTFMITFILVGGTCLYYMNQMRTDKNAKIEVLEKKIKTQTQTINKLQTKQDKSQISYDKEILELNKETTSQAKEINKLEKENAELTSELEQAKADLKKAKSNANSDKSSD